LKFKRRKFNGKAGIFQKFPIETGIFQGIAGN
jgi:hypothetical protein